MRRKQKTIMEKKNPIDEARRYVDNAKTILKEKGELDPETHSYTDRKYVKMAGNTLWNGVLLILDAVFHVKTVTTLCTFPWAMTASLIKKYVIRGSALPTKSSIAAR